MTKCFMVRNVNVPLLREQRNTLLKLLKFLDNLNTENAEYIAAIDGIVNLCDYMLDEAEGYHNAD